MIHNNEIIALFLTFITLIFILANRSKLKAFPFCLLFLLAFCFYALASIFSMLKWWFAFSQFNLMAHFGYVARSLVLAIWCWKVFIRKEEAS